MGVGTEACMWERKSQPGSRVRTVGLTHLQWQLSENLIRDPPRSGARRSRTLLYTQFSSLVRESHGALGTTGYSQARSRPWYSYLLRVPWYDP